MKWNWQQENWPNFEYNEKGLLTKKQSTKGDFVQIKYDKKLNKISQVKNNSGWTKFKYDRKGNLTTAQNSKKQAVKLIYDRKGKINKMVALVVILAIGQRSEVELSGPIGLSCFFIRANVWARSYLLVTVQNAIC